MRRALASVCLALTLAFAGTAHAQSTAALAETLYQEGKRLVAERNYEAACQKFAESYKLDPATGTLINLAACYESGGKYGTAWATFQEALVAAKREGQDFRVKFATDHLAALEDKITRFVIHVAPAANAPGLEVRLDGQVVPFAAFGVPAPIDPGTHVIDVSAPGKKPARLELLANAPRTVVTANVPILENAPEAPPSSGVAPASGSGAAAQQPSQSPSSPSREPVERGGTLRTVGYVMGAFGLVGVGTGAVFYFVARSQTMTAKSQCTRGPDDNLCATTTEKRSHQANVNDAAMNYNISVGSFIAGGAVLATGLLFVLVGGPTRDERALRVTPRFDASGGGLEVAGRF